MNRVQSTVALVVLGLGHAGFWLACKNGPSQPAETGARPDARYEYDGCVYKLPSESCVHGIVKAECHDGWCLIPKGCFVMGSPECEWGRGKNSENENETTLTRDYLMKQTEVTQAEWSALGLKHRSGVADSGAGDCAESSCPVGNVTWYEALAFANAYSESRGLPRCYALDGCSGQLGEGMTCSSARQVDATAYDCKGYRLPTEAEWEYAARAGTRSSFYSGQITPGPSTTECHEDVALERIGWYCANSGGLTHPVGGKIPNGFGLHDMSGNASEPTSDTFRGSGYGEQPRIDPGGVLEDHISFAGRGGLAWTWPAQARSARRTQLTRALAGPSSGLRLARTAYAK